MRTTDDPEVDAFYLYLGSGTFAESLEIRPGIVVDFDAEGRLIGIEVLDASKTLPKDIGLARMKPPLPGGVSLSMPAADPKID